MNIHDYISSGILELYVLGLTNAKENEVIVKLSLSNVQVREEIENISAALEEYGSVNAKYPDPSIKPFLMAMIDYRERLKSGEQPSSPPILNKNSKVSDYNQWINNHNLEAPDNFNNFYAKIIGYNPEVTTAIIWIKEMAPEEIHKHELEKFLILEGACDITIAGEVYSLKAGDYLTIPLYKKHDVKITSSIPCKAILQRIAA